jgi:hypothetical protein
VEMPQLKKVSNSTFKRSVLMDKTNTRQMILASKMLPNLSDLRNCHQYFKFRFKDMSLIYKCNKLLRRI